MREISARSRSRSKLIVGGWGMGLVRRYIRTLVVTPTGLLHQRKYIIPLRKAKATVTSSISVIVRPWAFLEMHWAINHVVCIIAKAFDRPSPLLLSWISFSEMSGNPISLSASNLRKSLGVRTEVSWAPGPSDRTNPPIKRKWLWVMVQP